MKRFHQVHSGVFNSDFVIVSRSEHLIHLDSGDVESSILKGSVD